MENEIVRDPPAQSFTHSFDAEKLEDIQAEAAEKGQSVELFLSELTVRFADVTQNILIPEWATPSMITAGDKLMVTLSWS